MSEEPSIISTLTSSANGKRKRQRVSQACERCRAKKYRCDGAGPPCAACNTADTPCNYGQVGQRRGLKSGYVKALETLWGLVLSKVPNSEHVATQLLATVSREDLDVNSPAALQAWRNSGLLSAITSLLDDEHPQQRDQETGQSLSHAAPWSLGPTADAEDPSERTSEEAPVQPSTSEPSMLPVNTQHWLPRVEDPTASPALPTEWQSLLQAYLSYEGSWLPMLPKSTIWRMAYAYEAVTETRPDSHGDVATLWAVFVLGEMHVNGAMSAGMQAMRTQAHALLAPTSSCEPDVSYAPAFLMWAVIHMGRQKFTLAKMKLVQAHVLTTSQSPSVPSTCGSLLTNACFVMDVLLAVATKSRPLDIGSKSPAEEASQGELTDWEPFIDPLWQQQNANGTISSFHHRPSQTYNTYDQFLKLCATLHSACQGSDLQSDSEATFDAWSVCLPSHLKFDSLSYSDAQETRLPSAANIQIFSLVFRSWLAPSPNDASISLTCNTPPRTEISKALTFLQEYWDIRRLPLSFGVVIHLLSVNLTEHPADRSLEDSLPSLRKALLGHKTRRKRTFIYKRRSVNLST
jgi:hypothetical protein